MTHWPKTLHSGAAVLAIVLSLRSYGGEAVEGEASAAERGRYVMVLKEPGEPIPGTDKHTKRHPEPDVAKYGGKLLHSVHNERWIELPVAAANQLRKNGGVAYLQRLWMGEPLGEYSDEIDATEPRPRGVAGDSAAFDGAESDDVEADGDVGLTWGPRTYAYDGSGNVKRITDARGPVDTYTYDTAGRLVQATTSGVTETFTYDGFGNLVERSTGGKIVKTAVDPLSNRLAGMTYDAAGNLVTRDGKPDAYQFDGFNMLTAANGRYMIYDAHDERLGVLVSTGLARWTVRGFDGQVLREYRSDPTQPQNPWVWEQDYVYAEGRVVGGERVRFASPSDTDSEGQPTSTAEYYGGKRHYHVDHLGSVRLVTSSAGKSVGEHDYYPFGITPTRTYQEQLNWSAPHIDAKRFAGHDRDFLGKLNVDSTEYLDYMHARYYDPGLARFLSVDPGKDWDPQQPQSWNLYTYVRNNPVAANDPTGQALVFVFSRGATAADTEKFLNANLVGQDANIGDDGTVNLVPNDEVGPPSAEQQAFASTLSTPIARTETVTMKIVSGQSDVQVGQYTTGSVDLGDIRAAGAGPVAGGASLFAHEVIEQTTKQVFGLPNTTAGFAVAHNMGNAAQSFVSGWTRGATSGHLVGGTGVVTTQHVRGGRIVVATLHFSNGNLVRVERK